MRLWTSHSGPPAETALRSAFGRDWGAGVERGGTEGVCARQEKGFLRNPGSVSSYGF